MNALCKSELCQSEHHVFLAAGAHLQPTRAVVFTLFWCVICYDRPKLFAIIAQATTCSVIIIIQVDTCKKNCCLTYCKCLCCSCFLFWFPLRFRNDTRQLIAIWWFFGHCSKCLRCCLPLTVKKLLCEIKDWTNAGDADFVTCTSGGGCAVRDPNLTGLHQTLGEKDGAVTWCS